MRHTRGYVSRPASSMPWASGNGTTGAGAFEFPVLVKSRLVRASVRTHSTLSQPRSKSQSEALSLRRGHGCWRRKGSQNQHVRKQPDSEFGTRSGGPTGC